MLLSHRHGIEERNRDHSGIVAENGTSIGGLPGEFGPSTLVIDPIRYPTDHDFIVWLDEQNQLRDTDNP
jgi:hypothetical protein